jgi:oligopeptide transport system substrate-binding protein
MDNLKVRQAFALGIDRVALSKFRKITKPLVDFTPNGIFPEFDEARKKVQAEKLKELKIDENDWNKRIFDPEKARKLLAEAGFPVEGSAGNYSCPKFPVDKVNITYNTAESNQKVAEFVQAQWKQNLGITVPLKNLEFKTFLPMLNKVEYDGFGRRGWVADYMDPFTYLDLFYTEANNGATGWTNKDYDKLLTKANATVDQEKRNELLAQAEFMVMQQQIIIPLAINATSWMKKPYVKGLYPNPATLHAWKFVYIERDPNKWDTDADKVMTEKDPIYDAQLEKLQAVQKAFEAEKKGEQAKNTEAK